MIMRRHAIAAVVVTSLSFLTSAPGAAEPVDQELVLAVDTSSSVSFHEYRLQMDGYAAAFRDRALVDAIEQAVPRGIAVTLIHWSSASEQRIVVDWSRIHDVASAAAFAEQIAAAHRIFLVGQTDIGAALDYAAGLFPDNGFESVRQTIDISGDGRSNQGEFPTAARDRAVARGIIINGLAILSDVDLLDRYYLDNIIGGTGSFSIAVDEFEDFGGAIVLKLITEIVGNTIAEAAPPSDGGG